ncbi:transaldolase [Brooklawnia cerclae]|uniref:Transaldolase n=1 Tax=Brooklawnia cerclae TaxID=349934 RepID=A0ABX0SL85_9ACTN|nr:transaldolase [Brooklawnia cerclae]NIH57476.1 transaldolase [Brooklawnia cerclae]
MNQNLQALQDAGVSIWLDDLSRQMIRSGELSSYITDKAVTGVTTNPSIFAAAFQDLSQYGAELSQLKADSVDVEEAIRRLTSRDVAEACRLFTDAYATSAGYDGRVSIEVAPTLAMDTAATIEQAAALHELVGEPNVLIKIPATQAGIPAIRATVAAGISVNVTLIFSIDRYHEVMDAYIAGLEDALAAGRDISTIHSVASFFVSRVDSEIDKRLNDIGTPAALALRGRSAVANARLAFKAYEEVFGSARFTALAAKGANVQRPLWASTSVKNPDYDDTMYVAQLVARPTVNTMPANTLAAFADHGIVSGDTITPNLDDAAQVLDEVQAQGIDLAEVCDKLEHEGVDKFVVSWTGLVEGVTVALARA